MERTEKYWICDDCAHKKGWVCDKMGITVIHGLCGHCKRQDDVTLTPVRDFTKKPKEGGRDE